MISLGLRTFPAAAHSPSLLTCDRLAVQRRASVAVRPRFPLIPASRGNGSDVGSGGGGSRGGGIGDVTGGGDEDDPSTEGFRVLDCIVQWLRDLLKLGALKDPLLAADFLSTMSIFTNIKDNVESQSSMECQSSGGMFAINLVGAEARSCNGKNNEEHGADPIVLNDTTNYRSSYSDKNTGVKTVTKGATNSPIHCVDIDNPDEENGSDENEKKMKGRRGFLLTIASSTLAYSMGLIPYWNYYCSNTPLSTSSGTWMDILPTAHIVVTISSLILTGLASHFKEGELPDNHGFKFLQIGQLLVVLWLWAVSFITLSVCRGTSNWVVWPLASASFCMIVLSWVAVFYRIEMVIKRTKNMPDKVLQRLRNLSLPERIKAKFMKVLGK